MQMYVWDYPNDEVEALQFVDQHLLYTMHHDQHNPNRGSVWYWDRIVIERIEPDNSVTFDTVKHGDLAEYCGNLG